MRITFIHGCAQPTTEKFAPNNKRGRDRQAVKKDIANRCKYIMPSKLNKISKKRHRNLNFSKLHAYSKRIQII
jgi:hypothetical protein